MIAGATAVIGINVARNAGLLPADGLEYTAFGSCVFGITVDWTLFRTRLFAVAPIARDAIVVVDADWVLVDVTSRQSPSFRR